MCDHDDAEQLTAATKVAQAQLELVRIREVRGKLMADMDLTAGNLDQLRRLAALDRYERFAATKRRRASRSLARLAVICLSRVGAFLSERTQSSMHFDCGMGIAEKIVYKQLFTSLLGRRVGVDLPDVGVFF
jgi:hypothetical protein